MTIEPIEAIAADELLDALSKIRAHIELLLKGDLKPGGRVAVCELVEDNLKGVALSIRASIEISFPDQRFMVEPTDTNEAWWFHRICKERGIFPLTEASLAILRIYGFLDTYKQKLSPQAVLRAFDELRGDIMVYTTAIRKYVDRRTRKQLSKNAGRGDRGAKRPTGYRAAILWHLENGFPQNPEQFWRHFTEWHSIMTDAAMPGDDKPCLPGVFDAGEYDVYYEPDNELNRDEVHPGFLCQRIPGVSANPRRIRYSTFQRHFYQCLKTIKKL